MSYEHSNALAGSARVDRPMSRVDGLVQQTKLMTDRVRSAQERIVRHAQTLGFFSPTPPTAAVQPTPVISTLEDALRDLDRSLDELAASLNLFD